MTVDIYNVQVFGGGASPIMFFPYSYFFPNYEYNKINMVSFGNYDPFNYTISGIGGLAFNYKDQMVTGGGGTGSFTCFLPIDIDVSGGNGYGNILYALENKIIVGIKSGTDYFIVTTEFDGYVTSSELGEPLKEFSNWRVTDIAQFDEIYSIYKLKNYYVLLGQNEIKLANSSFNIIKDIFTIPPGNTGWQTTITITDSGFYTLYGIDGGDFLAWNGPGTGINLISGLYNQTGDLINVIEDIGSSVELEIPLRSTPFKIGNKLFSNAYPIDRGGIGRESDIYRVYKSNGRYYTNSIELPKFIKLIPDVSLYNLNGSLLTPRALSRISTEASWSPIVFLCSNYPIGYGSGGYDYTSQYLGYVKNGGGWNLGRIPF